MATVRVNITNMTASYNPAQPRDRQGQWTAGGGLGLSPAAHAVMDVVTRAGGQPVVVGGKVRDAFLGRDSKDVDIEVLGGTHPDAIERALRNSGLKVDAVGKAFGVLKVTARNGEDFDVSFPRSESKAGVGHKGFEIKVDPTLSPEQAFARRDFTINAMGRTQSGELIDPFGGQADLKAKVLRHTSAAFGEDPLRVLRGVQFAGRFRMTMDPATAELSRSLKPEFNTIAKERIWSEFEKMASKGVAPSRSITVLKQTGWDEFFPEFGAGNGKAADRAASTARRLGMKGDERTAFVLAAMLHGTDAKKALGRIGATNEVTKLVLGLHGASPANASAGEVRRLARSLAKSGLSVNQWSRFRDTIDGKGGAFRRTASKLGVSDAPQRPFLSGDHLIAMGMRPGKELGKALNDALKLQDAGRIRDESEALAWARKSQLLPRGTVQHSGVRFHPETGRPILVGVSDYRPGA
jgi:tRNA nucleotidyltransferase (CCA-adding enzyme)